MSFGFSVGDFLAAIKLVNKIRKEFADAPSQFKAVNDEVRKLSIVLQDADVTFPNEGLNSDQKRDLEDIDKSCRNILDELQRILDKNSELSSERGSIGKRVKRVWKRLNWKPEDIDELRSRISTNVGLLTAFNGRLTRDSVLKLVHFHEDQERRAVLDWLTTIDYVPQQNDFIARRQKGTGQWLLDSTKYQSWRETNKQTLFCPGIPGAGKTILTSIVVEELTIRFSDDPTVGIAFIYCNFRRQHEQKIDNLLVSLLKQLAESQPSLPDTVKKLYDRHKKNQTRPSLDEISKSLQAVTTLYSRVFIIVDALDECQTSDGVRSKFLSEIFSLQINSGANLFATSRFIPEIIEKFNRGIQLEIRASDDDVRNYLDTCISQGESRILRRPDLQAEITTEIVKAIDGMFLLAQLHLNSLLDIKLPKDIRTALKNLPKGSEAYDCAYQEAMHRIECQGPKSIDLAKQVLSWITCSRRLLTATELQHALAVEVGETRFDKDNLPQIEDMISVCAGLVTVDEESDIIRLVHYTTQEYFQRTQKRWFPDAHTNIMTTCVLYLSFDEFERGICQNDWEFEQRLQSNKLYHYAAHNWGHHARETSTSHQCVIEFLKRQVQVEASSQALLTEKLTPTGTVYSQRFPNGITGLHLAAYFGIEAVVKSLLATGKVDIDSKDSYGLTPLSWAAENGHARVVEQLLATGKVDVDSRDNSNRTPLSWAAQNGHESIVELLLVTGKVDVDSIEYNNDKTPLSWAAENGHESIVELLLATGKVDVDSKDIFNRTPLWWAAWNGHEGIVKLLLATGKVDIDSKDRFDNMTPLSLAAQNGHEGIVELLLATGKVDVDSEDIDGLTPLSRATENGYERVVELLRKHKGLE